MPDRFCFINRETNEMETLQNIDEEMCKDCKIPCDPKHFCNLYQLCVMVGTSPRVQDESGNVDPEKLTKLIMETGSFSLTPHEFEIMKKYLCGKYTFNAWFQRH